MTVSDDKGNSQDNYSGKEFYSEVFRNVDFSGKDFTNSRFSDCTFENCNLSNINMGNTRFLNARFDGCKILGINFTRCNHFLMRMDFSRCIIQMCTFIHLEQKGICLKECKIYDCDFGYADLQGADFSGSDLRDSIFQNTNLSGASFINAINYSINPNENIIKKAKFSFPEAMSLLDKFDIIIE